uniref:Uncharacterized protein n=1 Tax=Sphaerodactylus townsendi TaxID=933632 RepID=A0ACB8EC35_9SAUR
MAGPKGNQTISSDSGSDSNDGARGRDPPLGLWPEDIFMLAPDRGLKALVGASGEAGTLIANCPEKQCTQAPSKSMGLGPKKKMTKGDKHPCPAKEAMATEETPSSVEESFLENSDTEESSELLGNDDDLA